MGGRLIHLRFLQSGCTDRKISEVSTTRAINNNSFWSPLAWNPTPVGFFIFRVSLLHGKTKKLLINKFLSQVQANILRYHLHQGKTTAQDLSLPLDRSRRQPWWYLPAIVVTSRIDQMLLCSAIKACCTYQYCGEPQVDRASLHGTLGPVVGCYPGKSVRPLSAPKRKYGLHCGLLPLFL